MDILTSLLQHVFDKALGREADQMAGVLKALAVGQVFCVCPVPVRGVLEKVGQGIAS